MTPKKREDLQRGAGILQGLTASGDVSDCVAEMLIVAMETIDGVLEEGLEKGRDDEN